MSTIANSSFEEDVKKEEHQPDHKQNMDECSGHMKKEANDPQEEKKKCNEQDHTEFYYNRILYVQSTLVAWFHLGELQGSNLACRFQKQSAAKATGGESKFDERMYLNLTKDVNNA